ncbi:hypothetical protein EAH89_24090 [Roseomonas nepalensis]|uniref:OmpA-like domain-containing protein n=1 Tax=Muricoccus nepalensis TaxID=1854500 RepID=A0A502FCA5_9PROT|nr:hypothetical protein [Roseomonas nepalensis]TPG47068.1 hypothetical protein EAH89_24090 [Roseomonas nepalensis]
MTFPDARRAAATALALLLAALPATRPAALRAQPATAAGTGATGTAVAAPEAEPGEPAEAPPAPASLATGPLRANIPVLPDLPLGPGFERLPIGGWRLTGRAGGGEADHASRLSIETIGRYLAEGTTGRVTVIAQVAGPAEDPSVARRTSLARAVLVKSALVGGGLPGTRIDLRPMGRTAEARDALDIIAPPARPARDEPPPPAPEPPPIPPPPAEPAPRAAAPARGSAARPGGTGAPARATPGNATPGGAGSARPGAPGGQTP